jgi:cytochrome c biogenesis protein CcmG, thiol:disulfide interchange protein DsbE
MTRRHMPAGSPRRVLGRAGRATPTLLAALVLLAGCATSSAQPAGGGAPAGAPVASNAIRLHLAGFGSGPAFNLPDDLGGRPLVLNVWASWCGPCRAEMPALQQVYLKAKDQVGFLGLDSRDVVDAARRFAAQTGVTYPLAADPDGQAAAKLGAAGLPTTLFIGPDGTLRGRHVGALTAADLRAAIHRYFALSIA